ncbi:hypothetical protein Ciccas_000177 [Cichlidogyrus casuarinus]|uniref:Uncharacterized protein n=1 Tax=Cichlidogyrus casuarinus TaxID=1844966 RepID=A0ABD2QNP1_9PLAT
MALRVNKNLEKLLSKQKMLYGFDETAFKYKDTEDDKFSIPLEQISMSHLKTLQENFNHTVKGLRDEILGLRRSNQGS